MVHKTIEQRLLDRSYRDGGCVRWTGAHNHSGYGYVWDKGQVHRVHRMAYELWVGPIPEGLTIDHVATRGCRFLDCIEPAHLEAVSLYENIRRGGSWHKRTHCPNGHEYTDANRYIHPTGAQVCRTCKRTLDLMRKKRKQEATSSVEGKDG